MTYVNKLMRKLLTMIGYVTVSPTQNWCAWITRSPNSVSISSYDPNNTYKYILITKIHMESHIVNQENTKSYFINLSTFKITWPYSGVFNSILVYRDNFKKTIFHYVHTSNHFLYFHINCLILSSTLKHIKKAKIQ